MHQEGPCQIPAPWYTSFLDTRTVRQNISVCYKVPCLVLLQQCKWTGVAGMEQIAWIADPHKVTTNVGHYFILWWRATELVELPQGLEGSGDQNIWVCFQEKLSNFTETGHPEDNALRASLSFFHLIIKVNFVFYENSNVTEPCSIVSMATYGLMPKKLR